MFRKEAIEYQIKRWEGKAVLLPGIPFALIILLSIFLLLPFLFLLPKVPTPVASSFTVK